MAIDSTGPKNLTSYFSLDDFVEKSKEAGESDRVVVSETASGEQELVVEKETTKQRFYRLLAKFPPFKNIPAIRDYLEKIEFSNKQVFGHFITALAKCYGNDVATVGICSQLKKSIPLDQRNITAIKSIADIYQGIGAARTYSRNVVINIWPYLNIDNGGHVSLSIKNADTREEEHISWWPNTDFIKKASKETIAQISRGIDKFTGNKFNLHSNFVNKFGGSLESYKQDIDYEIDTAAEKMAAGEKARAIISRRILDGSWTVTMPAPKGKKEVDALKEKIENLYTIAKEDRVNGWAINRDANDLKLLLESSYRPRATQIKILENKKWSWVKIAQKVFFPLSGKTNVEGEDGKSKSKFVMFGLNEKAILADARYVKENANAYLELKAAEVNLNDPRKINEWQKKFHGKQEEIAQREGAIFLKKEEIAIKSKEIEIKPEMVDLRDKIKKYNDVISKLLNKENGAVKYKDQIKKNEDEIKKANNEVNKLSEPLEELNDDLEELKNNLAESEDELREIEDDSLENLLKKAQDRVKNAGEEIGYTFASNTNNCASMALRVFRAGGAENYVTMPNLETFGAIRPDKKFQNYAKSVQKEIDRLNDKADYVLEKLEKRAPISENIVTNIHEIESFQHIYLSPAWGAVTSSEVDHFKKILDIISNNFPSATDDVKSLNTKTKNMVVSAEELFKKMDVNAKPSKLEVAIEKLLHKTFNLHKQQIAKQTTADQ